MDLLLYLVRRHEVEITEIPVAPITEQFLEYLAVLEAIGCRCGRRFSWRSPAR